MGFQVSGINGKLEEGDCRISYDYLSRKKKQRQDNLTPCCDFAKHTKLQKKNVLKFKNVKWNYITCAAITRCMTTIILYNRSVVLNKLKFLVTTGEGFQPCKTGTLTALAFAKTVTCIEVLESLHITEY